MIFLGFLIGCLVTLLIFWRLYWIQFIENRKEYELLLKDSDNVWKELDKLTVDVVLASGEKLKAYKAVNKFCLESLKAYKRKVEELERENKELRAKTSRKYSVPLEVALEEADRIRDTMVSKKPFVSTTESFSAAVLEVNKVTGDELFKAAGISQNEANNRVN